MYTLRDLTIETLRAEKRPLTTAEIWECAVQRNFPQKGQFRGKTPWRSIGAQMYVEMRDEPESTPFVKIDAVSPVRFYLKELVTGKELAEIEAKQEEVVQKELKFVERDLHPLLLLRCLYEDYFSRKILKEIIRSMDSS